MGTTFMGLTIETDEVYSCSDRRSHKRDEAYLSVSCYNTCLSSQQDPVALYSRLVQNRMMHGLMSRQVLRYISLSALPASDSTATS